MHMKYDLTLACAAGRVQLLIKLHISLWIRDAYSDVIHLCEKSQQSHFDTMYSSSFTKKKRERECEQAVPLCIWH